MSWLEDLEYEKMGLPRPDLVLYLDMQPQTAKKLLETRYHGDESKKDLHEADFQYLLSCRRRRCTRQSAAAGRCFPAATAKSRCPSSRLPR